MTPVLLRRFQPCHRHTFARWSLISLLLLLLTACAPEAKFIKQVDQLAVGMTELAAGLQGITPAAVVSRSALQGKETNRLEEYVAERLAMKLRNSREIYALTRQNWFELREGEPLTFAGQPREKRSYLNDLTVYQVATVMDEVLKQINVQVTATDAQGVTVPGVLSEFSFPLDNDSPAAKQYLAKAKTNPIPEGVEERPYQSLDRLSYSLARELVTAYSANVSGDPRAAASHEVSVVIQSRAVNNTLDKLALTQIESALQQAIVANRGFTCAVSQRDFAPTFDQANFYRKNRQEFAIDETLFQPGTVVLLLEAAPHADGDKLGIALRALWRTTPLETGSGELIATNLAGTFLSGFTAKGYIRNSQTFLPASNENSPGVRGKTERAYKPSTQHGFE